MEKSQAERADFQNRLRGDEVPHQASDAPHNANLPHSTDAFARLNRAAVNRELRVIELKNEVNALYERLGECAPYSLNFELAAETPAVNSPAEKEVDGLVPLEAIVCTDELKRRPTRPPDYEAETRALSALAQALADSPRTILQTLAEKIVEVMRAGSAGLSLLARDGKRFYWAAIAGAWSPHVGGGTPRDFGPCGDVLDCDAPMLFRHWERRYPYLLSATPLAEEGLLVPFYVNGKSVGTVWAIGHNASDTFDAEDLRLLERLSHFASAAYQVVESLGEVDERRAAISLMEDAVQARQAIARSEAQLRQLGDAMPQIVWTAGPDGRIDYLNHRWTEFTGLPQSVSNDAWGPLLHPDDSQQANERWAASVRTGSSFDMEIRLLDYREQEYRWHLIRTIAVRDEVGKVARWYGTATDIHEQKRAQEASHYLAQASAVLATIVDFESTLQTIVNLAVPFFADWAAANVLRDGVLQRLAVAHQDPQKIELAHQLMQEYPPDPEAMGGIGAVLRTAKPEIMSEVTDELLVHSAKDERHLQLMRSLELQSYICVPLVVSGSPLGVLTFATSESRRRYGDADLALAIDLAHRASVALENTQLYQALREADRRKDEFLATLAHELRNPLAPIRNSLEILKTPTLDAETAGHARDMMERQIHHLVRLVDDLLDVSRVMRGKIELRKERVDLAAVIERAVETVQPLIDSQRHQVSIRLTHQSLTLDADPVRLTQIIGNLLTNAAKYTEPQGRIEVEAKRDGNCALLLVRDNGIGIPAAALARIFDLFVQTEQAEIRSQGGLGIGLTLVRNLVELHNGTIEARSNGPGTGSEFVLRLPLSPAAALEPDDCGASDRRQLPPAGFRILVVDDNQDAANSLGLLLRLGGHEVQVAYSGLAAFEIVKEYVPHVIVLDIGMPGMDGYEVAQKLRQQPALQKSTLIALTGWGQPEDRRRTAAAGFDRHFVKPLDTKLLRGLLDELKIATDMERNDA